MYAIAFDVEGKVAISGRFRPADDRSMLVDHFAHVLPADIGPINNAKTWEVSRAFSIEYGQRHHNLQRKAACILTTFEVALAQSRCLDHLPCRKPTGLGSDQHSVGVERSEEHTSELQSLMRLSYAV